MSSIAKRKRFIKTNSEAKLLKWFKKLTPEQRLSVALEIEEFRRGVRFVENRKDVRSIKRK